MVERRTPEREVGVRFSLTSSSCALEQDTLTSQKVMVVPRKRWFRPDMTEKLLSGPYSKNETKRIDTLTPREGSKPSLSNSASGVYKSHGT